MSCHLSLEFREKHVNVQSIQSFSCTAKNQKGSGLVVLPSPGRPWKCNIRFEMTYMYVTYSM